MIRDTVIVDLDGTLANGKARNWAVPNEKDAHFTWAWDKHNLLCLQDLPIQDTIDVVNALHDAGYRIIILTGRCNISEALTIEWLNIYNVHYDALIMRDREDHRPDTLIKEEELLLIGLDRIMCCFDDLEHVATMMRGLGLTCYLVNKYTTPRVDTVAREDRT